MVPSIKICVLILSILYFKLGEAQQQDAKIIEISQEQIKDIGDTLELNCTIQNSKYNVGWARKDAIGSIIMLTMSDKLLFQEPRYDIKIANDSGRQSYSLIIKNVTKEDAGEYMFQILASMTEIIKETVKVQIRHPPIINDKALTEPAVTTENQTVQLSCQANGFPRPTITWRREYDAIMSNGGLSFVGNILKINTVRKEDRGRYQCTADNGIGEPDVKSYELAVEFAPIVTAPRPKVAQALDYDIELECRVLAFPSPAVVWYRNGQQLYNNDHYRISSIGSAGEVTQTVIKIVTIENDQYGDYYCKATNKIGSAETRINVFEQMQPNINFSGLRWLSAGNSIFAKNNFKISIALLILTVLFNQ